MSPLAAYLSDLKRSRFFLPGVGLGALLGFGLSAAWFQSTLPQWRPTGSAAARTAVRLETAPGAPIVLKRGAVIVCEGDSLTYGFKRWGESIPGINGSPSPRSPTPYPETLRGLLDGKVTVVNHGKPGDQTLDGLTRWARAPTGDLTIIMYGANDAKVRGKPGALDVKVYASWKPWSAGGSTTAARSSCCCPRRPRRATPNPDSTRSARPPPRSPPAQGSRPWTPPRPWPGSARRCSTTACT